MLETPHLLLKLWTESEAQAFYELTQDEGFNRFPITNWKQDSLQSALAWIETNNQVFRDTKTGVLAIWEKSSSQAIGIGALRVLKLDSENRPEITYRLLESAWGKGYATEASNALLDYGFNSLNFNEIAVSITPDNLPSIKIAGKLGMQWTGNEILLGVPAEIFRIKKQNFEKQ